jgi:superfamily II DNA/RNA helicase
LIHVRAKELVPESIEHEYVECSQDQRFQCLRYLIKKELEAYQPTAEETRKPRAKSPFAKYFTAKRSAGAVTSTGSTGKNHSFQAIVFLDDDIVSGSSGSPVSLRMSKYASAHDGSVASEQGKDSSLIYSLIDSLERLFDDRRNGTNKNFIAFLTEHMSLDQRAESLDSFRNGESNVLLCTSCAARGIDIPSITHVFQLSLPKTVDDYVHQIGRAGRLGRSGKAITIIAPGSDFAIERYSNEIGVSIKKRTLKAKA